jgi:hypothetical protein
VHLISTGISIPVDFLITVGSIHDNTALQMMDINLPENSHLYADTDYLNGEIKDLLLEFQQIKLKAATKKTLFKKILGQKN